MNEDAEIIELQIRAPYLHETQQYGKAIEATVESHPVLGGLDLLRPPTQLFGVHLISDFVSDRQFRDLPIYREAYRHIEVKNQMLIELNFTPKRRTLLAMNSLRPIGDEQRMFAEFVVHHLVIAYRNMLRYSQPECSFGKNDPRRELQEKLSPRLQEVLGYLLSGLPRKMIADKLDLSIHTVNGYVKEIYAKFNLHSHAELMALFVTNYHFSPKK